MHNHFPKLNVFSGDSSQQPFESLDNLSVLTKNVNNYIISSISGDNNFILAYPDTMIQNFPILCANFVYANRYSIKDILVFSTDNDERIEKNPLRYHIRNLSTIAEGRDLLYTKAVPCIFNQKDETVTIEGDFSLRSPEEMAKAFAHVPEAVENTVKIADKCNVEIEFGQDGHR